MPEQGYGCSLLRGIWICSQKSCWIFGLLVFLLQGCHNEDYGWLDKEEGVRVLDLKYVNDTLGLVLRDIRVVASGVENRYAIRAYLEARDPERYIGGHYFYIHFYPKKAKEGSGKFTGVTTQKVFSKKGLLVFEGTLNTDRDHYEMMRYGLVSPAKERLFSLEVDTLDIHMKQPALN